MITEDLYLTIIIDHSKLADMATKPGTISVSQFKATCLAVMEEVRRTGKSVIITKRGVPIAELIPPSAATRGSSWMGSMEGTCEIVGDIVSPIMDPDEWEANTE